MSKYTFRRVPMLIVRGEKETISVQAKEKYKQGAVVYRFVDVPNNIYRKRLSFIQRTIYPKVGPLPSLNPEDYELMIISEFLEENQFVFNSEIFEEEEPNGINLIQIMDKTT